jgi:hypothetical protein
MWYYSLCLVIIWTAAFGLLVPGASATPLQRLKSQTIQCEYDFIIIGGMGVL